MIDIKHLVENTSLYAQELVKRGKDGALAEKTKQAYLDHKDRQQEFENLRQKQNEFNKKVVQLSGEEKQAAIAEMKGLSEQVKILESETRELKEALDQLISKIPNLTWEGIPVGKSDEDNPVIGTWGTKPVFDGYDPKPYWELPVYQKYVSQDDGVKAMGSRGYYMHGQMAWFQKVLFDYALSQVMKEGFELFYVPLMLNDTVLTGTGHLPDFDGQQYEVPIDEGKSFYLIGSSEPSIMGYFMDKNLGELEKPVLATCWSSCFRKEAGSYGKDQQGILRVHQFEKVEMVAIAKPEETEALFEKFSKIVEGIYSSLGLHFQAVEVCSGDIPHKHRRQKDYEVWFPAVNRFRENCSNGNASDYQNRGLRITYNTQDGNRRTPWGLNCTAITFRTGLAILEQYQQEDGSVRIPEVLRSAFGKDLLE
ncbi:MAG: serine--tRNA ligase [Patescibacteria group bacterium]